MGVYSHVRAKRLLCFLCGLIVLGFGVALSTRPGLGTTPITSVPLVFSKRFPLTLGQWSFGVNVLLVCLQWAILRKKFRLRQWGQLGAALLFGMCIDLGMLLARFVTFDHYFLRLAEQLLGSFLIANGILFQLAADFSCLPGEGMVQTITHCWKLDFGKVKIGFDLAYVALALLLSLFFFGNVEGIREGTLIAALSVGWFVKLLLPKFHIFLRSLLRPHHAEKQIAHRFLGRKIG